MTVAPQMSAKFPSPLLGYNNNVRHKGRVFHIQTEDSGAKYGHIITHLFMDGGRILKSVKTSYSEYIGSERMSEIVREMMKQQHKAMFIALRDGKFDPVADGVEGNASSTGALPRVSQDVAAASLAPVPPAASAAPAEGIVSAKPAIPSSPRLPAEHTERPQAGRYASQSVAAVADDTDPAPPTERQSGSSAEITLDVGAIERATTGASAASPVLRDAGDLPPPPASLFREKGTGRYRVTPEPPAVDSPEDAAGSPERAPSASRSSSTNPAVKGGSERRYAPTRPASIFGQARPAQGKSIFGGDLISDKSLDEVILSYLAEDLDEKK